MTNVGHIQTVLERRFTPSRMHADQNEIIAAMAAIVEQRVSDDAIVVSVIGGAASGKSTLAEELVALLLKSDIRADLLCTDNYAKGDRHYRQVILKEADASYKYDLQLLDEHIDKIRGLRSEQNLDVPVIDDETGMAADKAKEAYDYEIQQVDVLVVEGDLPRDDYDLRFYIHMPDDKRLENNIDRDAGTPKEARQLTENFNTRQRTLHKPYTQPALDSADYVIATDAEGDDWWYTMYRKKAA